MLDKIEGSYKEDMNAAIRRGTRKTHISMGTGCGNLAIPYSVLEELRKLR